MREDPLLRNMVQRVTVASAAVVVVGVGAPAPGWASADPNALNGTYTAQSNGQWSKTNERFEQRPAVISTWTVETTCSTPTDCSGLVTSDLGWSANIYKRSGVWYVKNVVPEWLRCPDGSAYDGLQVFRFYPVNPDGTVNSRETTNFAGLDKTTAPSGACGKNQWLVIDMPFKLRKVT